MSFTFYTENPPAGKILTAKEEEHYKRKAARMQRNAESFLGPGPPGAFGAPLPALWQFAWLPAFHGDGSVQRRATSRVFKAFPLCHISLIQSYSPPYNSKTESGAKAVGSCPPDLRPRAEEGYLYDPHAAAELLEVAIVVTRRCFPRVRAVTPVCDLRSRWTSIRTCFSSTRRRK